MDDDKRVPWLNHNGCLLGSKILFVGTKRIARASIQNEAIRAGMPYVNQSWRGGNLTNYRVTSRSVKALKDMESIKAQEDFGANMTKKEVLKFERELLRLEKGVGGLKDMIGLPDALFVVDIGVEKIAIDNRNLGEPNKDSDAFIFSASSLSNSLSYVFLVYRRYRDG